MDDTTAPVPNADAPPFEEVGLDNFTPYLLARIVGRYNTKLAHNSSGESLTIKMRVLTILADRDMQTVNELTVLAVTKQSTMSRVLATMLEEGLIQRIGSEEDHRSKLHTLTAKGRQVFDDFWPKFYQSSLAIFEGLEAAERDQFQSLLKKILQNIKQNPF